VTVANERASHYEDRDSHSITVRRFDGYDNNDQTSDHV